MNEDPLDQVDIARELRLEAREVRAVFDWRPHFDPVWSLCECVHAASAHKKGGFGACTGRDSYDQPCACPSFEMHQEEREEHEQPPDGRDTWSD